MHDNLKGAREALRGWFLGPRAENADLLERLVTEALRDHIFWRRNYHPEDGFTIREIDKRTPGYEDAVATLTQELMGLLAELKRGVPFFTGRYKGHMSFEQTIAAQIGYFAAMLYNPNNVSIEASPVTTRLELQVAEQLARMIGYDEARSWGHLTSGGTIANFEALWVARNIIYLPIAAAGAAEELGVDLELSLPNGEVTSLADASLWQLVNIRNHDALQLYHELWQTAPRADVQRAFHGHSLQTLGYQDYHRRLSARYGDPLSAAVVLVPATAHYSWEKIARALGIGSNQVVYVRVDDRYRMDPDWLWQKVQNLSTQRAPILACISVCGTTEESAIDRLDQIVEVRARAQRELGVTFHLHSDACYGGYAASLLTGVDGTRRSASRIRKDIDADFPSDEWVAAMEALGQADSVTIDPHKLGYTPYPAGAILFRDRRARELVATDPPYLLPSQGMASAEDLFLGRFILEGSKPGAAAAAVWLSHKVLPLDERGYGYLISRTMLGARKLHRALRETDFSPFRVVVLPEPDINIVCYVLHHPALTTLHGANEFNERIYAMMSLSTPGASPNYIITRTRFQTPMYDGAVDPILSELGVCTPEEWRQHPDEGLIVLRSTVMDPFAITLPPAPDHIEGFVQELRRVCDRALSVSPS
ncbi:MAG TPA: pyridoxal-dependent decarboxylase [Longimicrobiales bacterium]|nr:pyridoxal-dependent decarboxylase [Longimicrobiales bacterium]